MAASQGAHHRSHPATPSKWRDARVRWRVGAADADRAALHAVVEGYPLNPAVGVMPDVIDANSTGWSSRTGVIAAVACDHCIMIAIAIAIATGIAVAVANNGGPVPTHPKAAGVHVRDRAMDGESETAVRTGGP